MGVENSDFEYVNFSQGLVNFLLLDHCVVKEGLRTGDAEHGKKSLSFSYFLWVKLQYCKFPL